MPQSQCTNLELSQELKGLGYPQKSLFKWHCKLDEKLKQATPYEIIYYPEEAHRGTMIAAPTVAELLEVLHGHINALQPLGQFSSCTESVKRWVVFGTDKRTNFGGDTPQEALAKMLIYLLKNNLIEL